MGYSPWGHKESDTTEHAHTHTHTHIQTMDYYAVLNISELSGHEKTWNNLKYLLFSKKVNLKRLGKTIMRVYQLLSHVQL